MRALTVPVLVLTGDEDWPCLAPGLLVKQNIPSAGLAVIPNSGHTINVEILRRSMEFSATFWPRWMRAAGLHAIRARQANSITGLR